MWYGGRKRALLWCRLKQKAAEKLSAQRSKQHKEKQRTSTLKADPDIATFEKHTKGFGMKMMQAMGTRATCLAVAATPYGYRFCHAFMRSIECQFNHTFPASCTLSAALHL